MQVRSMASSTPTPESVGVLGSEVKKIIETIREVRALGITGLKEPLPKICVVGDQSTGKSSLIEGIS